ncbi:MAG: SDR family NAD(P)-dependent oxidoreductase [Alphaproteobacteria bacterium]|nr:SDR family NAD(P)-dependent oxidoreductase [Alphaproteobacteria bacterium]MCB9696247.1 SDR family NAD(P)-dependent oxidoreductase [Alphaproteobacteria bacterium]
MLTAATDLARRRRHRAVLPEHLLRSLLDEEVVTRWLADLGASPEALADDVDAWLDGLDQVDEAPRPVTSVDALVRGALSGDTVPEAAALAALAGLPDSQASKLLRRRGLTRTRLTDALDRLARSPVPEGLWEVVWEDRPLSTTGSLRTEPCVLQAHGDDAEALHGALSSALARLRELAADTGEVWVVSRGDLVGAGLLGLGRVLALERPELRVRRLTLDPDADARAAIEGELAEPGRFDEVRRLGGRRQVPRLRPVTGWLPEQDEPSGGSLLITGGLGAIGVRVARHLAPRFDRVVLVGRTPDRPEAEALRASLGERVSLVAADVADRDAMRAVLDGLPDLRAVVHAAGVLDDALLQDHDPDRIARVLRPKVVGAQVLLELLDGRPPPSLVFLSSVAGALGSPGQGAYAAANAALDQLARDARARGLPVRSVGFGPWAEAGMSAGLVAVQRARGLVALSTPRALALLDAALRLPAVTPLAAIFDATPTLGADTDGSPPAELDEGTVLGWIEAALRPLVRQPSDADTRFDELGLDSLGALEVRRTLTKRSGVALPATALYTHPTARALATAVVRAFRGEPSAPDPEPVPSVARDADDGRIAIVGWSCRLPGGVEAPEDLWALLERGGDAIVPIGADRFDVDAVFDPSPATPGRTCARRAGLVADLADFDAAAFGVPAWEADWLDPQHRLLLEGCAAALASSGRTTGDVAQTRTGVFVGLAEQSYAERLPPDATTHPPSALAALHPAFATGRLAARLGLRGPVATVNTACSSSLVALHEAVGALRAGTCSMALVAGVQALCSSGGFTALSALGLLSPTDMGRAFDAGADGYVRGEGCVVLVLRRLSEALADGDPVLGVVRGTAVAHGGGAAGLLVPSVEGEEQVMRDALADARAVPAEVEHVACHAVGAALADVVETQALSAVYGRERAEPLVLSSVKPVIGHLEAAAGLASLLHALLTLRHGAIPAQLHLRTPHPDLVLDGLRLADTRVSWPVGERPRLAAVSAFGLGGTNAHAILEEAPPHTGRAPLALEPRRRERHWLDGGAPAVRAALGSREAVVAFVREQLAELTGVAALAVPEDEPLARHGLDSMRAVELRARLLRAGRDVPVRVLLLDPSLAAIADAASPLAAPSPGSHVAPEAPGPSMWTHAAALLVGMALAVVLMWVLRQALPDYAPAGPDLQVFPAAHPNE